MNQDRLVKVSGFQVKATEKAILVSTTCTEGLTPSWIPKSMITCLELVGSVDKYSYPEIHFYVPIWLANKHCLDII